MGYRGRKQVVAAEPRKIMRGDGVESTNKILFFLSQVERYPGTQKPRNHAALRWDSVPNGRAS